MDPVRIVSLVPSHTQSLHDLGLKDRVVGRTRFCIHPEPWVGWVPTVGGTKDAKLEKILALEPDLVVADKDENPKPLVDALEAAGIEVLWSEIDSVPDAAEFLERLGRRCGAPTAGHVAAERIRLALDEVGGESIAAWCPIWYDPWMTFDATAYPSAMLAAVGIRNVFADHDGPKYFEVNPQQVAASGAAWTLLPTEPYPFHKRRDAIDLTGLGSPGARSRIIDGEALTWFGTHTATGLRLLHESAEQLRAADEEPRGEHDEPQPAHG